MLRSFTTAAVALTGRGGDLPGGGRLGGHRAGRFAGRRRVGGAIAGGDPAPGFEYGNSPAALLEAELAGRRVVMSTAAGVRGLQRFRDARQLFAASLVCARATAAAIRAAGPTSVLRDHRRVGRPGRRRGRGLRRPHRGAAARRPAPPEDFARRVRDSDFSAGAFVAGTWPNLPLADLELAAHVDRFDFAMPVAREASTW